MVVEYDFYATARSGAHVNSVLHHSILFYGSDPFFISFLLLRTMNTAFGTLIFLLCIKQLVIGCSHIGKTSVNCYGLNHRVIPQNLLKSAEVSELL